jgi:glycosyltransferase involved in cell wall biosynthesis
MKVMFYLNALGMGGAEKVVTNLANQFVEHGDLCVVVTSNYAEIERTLDRRVKRIALFEKRLNNNIVERNVILFKRLRKQIKQEKPDVVISFMGEPNFRMLFSSVGLPIKRVVSIRNDPNHEYPSLFKRWLAKFLYRFADGVVFQTQEAKEWFPKSIQRRSKIIFNQVEEIFFQTSFSGEHRDIILTGSLEPRKNHKLLIDAFSQIADQVEENIYIYGKGSNEEREKEYIRQAKMEDRIFLMGPTKDVANTIKSSKLFILSSDYEGMPNALMEAMALGLPCISTDCPCGGPRVLFGKELHECLFPVKDTDKLAELMLSLLKDQQKLNEIGQIAKIKAEAFRPEVIFEDWRSYISSIIQ